MKLDSKWYSRVLILNSATVFLNFVSKIPVLGKFTLETSYCFVQNKNLLKEIFRGADSKFNNIFSYILSLKYLCWANLVPKIQSPLSYVKLSKKRYYLILLAFYMTFITLYFYSLYLNFFLVTANIKLAFTCVQLSEVNILCIFLSSFLFIFENGRC